METIKDCLDFIDVVIVIDYKTIKFVDNFEQMRECIIDTYHEKIFVNEMNLLRILSQKIQITEKFFFDIVENFKKDVHNFRGFILYMLSAQKTYKDEKEHDSEE